MQFVFNYTHFELSIPGAEVDEKYISNKSDAPLFFEVQRNQDTFTLNLSASGGADEYFVGELLNYYHYFIQAIANGDTHYPTLIPEEEYKLINTFNANEKDYPQEQTIPQVFEHIAKTYLKQIALIAGSEQISYANLNQRANQVAHYIRSRYFELTTEELKPESLIALYVDRSVSMIAGILGILKAGCAYIPLDLAYSVNKITEILEDAQPQLVLTNQGLADWMSDYITIGFNEINGSSSKD